MHSGDCHNYVVRGGGGGHSFHYCGFAVIKNKIHCVQLVTLTPVMLGGWVGSS